MDHTRPDIVHLEARQGRSARGGFAGELRLHKGLHDALLLSIKGPVQLLELLERKPMAQNNGRVERAVLNLLQEFVPVLLNRSLTRSSKRDALLHQRADEESVSRSGVIGDESNVAKLADGLQHLVGNLGGIGLKADGSLKGVQGPLCVSEGGSVNAAVDTLGFLLVQRLDNVLGLAKVDDFAANVVSCHGESLGNIVNGNDTLRTSELGPFAGEEANWTQTPNRNTLAFLNLGTDGSMIRRGDNVGQIESLLIRNGVRELQEIDFAKGSAYVFRLAPGIPASEACVAEETPETFAVELALDRGVVGGVAHGGQALFAERALSASRHVQRENVSKRWIGIVKQVEDVFLRNLEAGNNSVTLLQLFDIRADFVDNTKPLVAQDVS